MEWVNMMSRAHSIGYGEDSNGVIVSWNLDPVDWDPTVHGFKDLILTYHR